MKKTANKKHARLQSIDSAQLAQVTGGATLAELCESTRNNELLNTFFSAAAQQQVTGYNCTGGTCTPRY